MNAKHKFLSCILTAGLLSALIPGSLTPAEYGTQCSVMAAEEQDAESDVNIIELYGENRYETMTQIAEESFGEIGSSYAVVTTGTSWPDALAAASLAGTLDAPVILVSDTQISYALEELENLGVTDALIMGGTAAVSDSIEAQIEALGIETSRISGKNRMDTAMQIASEVQMLSGEEMSDTCLVATGGNFADALSASSYAYYTGSPIYLTRTDGEITDDILSAIQAGGYENIIILGGTSAVTEAAEEALDTIEGAHISRIAGENRYETSCAFAAWAVTQGMTYDGLAIATGRTFSDALSGASLCGQSGSVMLLTSPTKGITAVQTILEENADEISSLYILGGTSAVTNSERKIIYGCFGADYEIEQDDWVADLKLAQDVTQMIIVEASGGYTATLSMHTCIDGKWTRILSTSAYIGKNGIGKTAEGDGKTPTGVYSFTKAFGIQSDPGTSFSYLQVDSTYYWVDDSDSAYYNRLVSTRNVTADWDSAEHIIDYTTAYAYVLALNYNETCTPGKGSAIFLHCSTGGATAGCISVSQSDMITILKNVQTDCVIVIDYSANITGY